jgi:hypothetical protein
MEQDPGNDIERRMAIRLEAWNKAAEEHMVPLSRGAFVNLAMFGLRAWSHLEATDPDEALQRAANALPELPSPSGRCRGRVRRPQR